MKPNDFWKGVREELDTYNLLCHPFYQAWAAGELTPEEIGFYAWQYLNHVTAFPTYLTALHCRLLDGATRRAILANAAEEEAQGTAHADLWAQFAAEMDPARVSRECEIVPEIRRLVQSYRDMAQNATPPVALGAFYSYESQVPLLDEVKLAGLKSFYGASDAACAYFEVHRTADIRHATVWSRLIDHWVDENPRSTLEVLNGVKRGAKALWYALDGIESRRQTLSFQ
jgi:pyrroloquinoline-quinone synthase